MKRLFAILTLLLFAGLVVSAHGCSPPTKQNVCYTVLQKNHVQDAAITLENCTLQADNCICINQNSFIGKQTLSPVAQSRGCIIFTRGVVLQNENIIFSNLTTNNLYGIKGTGIIQTRAVTLVLFNNNYNLNLFAIYKQSWQNRGVGFGSMNKFILC